MPPGEKAFAAGLVRRENFLEIFERLGSVKETCKLVGIRPDTYRKYRSLYPAFASKVDLLKKVHNNNGHIQQMRGRDSLSQTEWRKTEFAIFRKHYYKMDTPDFQYELVKSYENTEPGRITMILCPPEHGKGLALDTPLPTPDGWITMGEVETGDLLMGVDGSPTRVLHTSPVHNIDCYRVTFSGGDSLVCDGDHLWQVDWKDAAPKVLDTRTLLTYRPARVPIHQGFAGSPVDFQIDPYLLGIWLGDGASAGAVISTGDPEVLDAFRAAGFDVNHRSQYDYGISANWDRSRSLKTLLRKLNLLDNKHIPADWLRASFPQRLALLQGLMDSDGYCSPTGQCEFSQMPGAVAKGTEELIRSLGMKVRRYPHQTGAIRLSFYPDLPVFRLKRKLDQIRPGNKRRHEAIVSILPIETVPTRCVYVDAHDSLYLAGRHMHVTHNTTLFEDYASWKLAMDPSYRFTVGSESQSMSRKILSRVKLRMDPDGPFPRYVEEWGPFIPQTKGRRKNTGNADSAIRQPWGADFFNVYKKSDHDERDFSMVALGIGSQVAGTRTDHLHLDDVQSLNNIASAVKDAQKIRQDWFSRPGQRGRTTINGTKVEVGDIYEILEEELTERVLTVIRLPAIVERGNGPEPLWPWDEATQSGWTMEMLDRQREIVGEDAWSRNYMQKAVAKGDSTFTEESVGRCLNPLRSMLHDPDPEDGPIVIGVDPSIGGMSAFAVTQYSDKKFILLESRTERGLTTNSQIFRVVEELILRWTGRGCICSDVIIETMAFQKGLIEDEELLRLRDLYGFRARGHLTGRNKYDENIGLASMATSFMKCEVDLPYAEDSKTRHNTDDFKRECLAWRPRISGAKLRQDRLMAFWFCWIEWRKRRRIGIMDRSTPTVTAEGLGYEPTVGNLFGQGGKYDAA